MHILTSFTAYFALFHQGRFVFVSKNIFLVIMVFVFLYCNGIHVINGKDKYILLLLFLSDKQNIDFLVRIYTVAASFIYLLI